MIIKAIYNTGLCALLLTVVSCSASKITVARKDTSELEMKTAVREGNLDNMLYEFLVRNNHGKNIITAGKNKWLVLETDSARGSTILRLTEVRIDNSGKPNLGGFVNIAGPAGLAIKTVHGEIVSSAIIKDKNGLLYVVYSDDSGISVIRSKMKLPISITQLKKAIFWEPIVGTAGSKHTALSFKILGDLLISDEGSLIMTSLQNRHEDNLDEIGLVTSKDGNWQYQKLFTGKGLFPPTAMFGTDGVLHITWSDVFERVFYTLIQPENRQLSNLNISPLILRRKGRQPVITFTNDKKVLIAFEADQSTGIEYSLIDNNKIVQSGLLTNDARFHREIFHSPQFTIDNNGTVWVFFINSTRNYIFSSRWLGHSWGPLTTAAGIRSRPTRQEYRFLPIGRLFVPKDKDKDNNIAVYLHAEDPIVARAFSIVKPLSFIPAQPGRKILFLDMQEVAYMQGLQTIAGKAVKSELNPLFEPNNPNRFDATNTFNSGRVLYEDGRFRLWYASCIPDSSVPWWHTYRTGYAESNDGLEWKRIDTGYKTGINKNILPDMPAMVSSLFRDDQESDPNKLYKLLEGYYYSRTEELLLQGQLERGGGRYHGRLFTSPDGIKWNRQPIKIECPGGKNVEVVPQSMFRDTDEADPNKLFKAYGYTSITQGQRGGAVIYSPDAVHWTAYENNPVMAPELRGCPFVPAGPFGDVHDVSVFKYAGYYLALYQYLYNPTGSPGFAIAADIELAMSRDGFNFNYLNCGEKVIERGKPDQWDSSMLVSSIPLIINDEIWLYYGGTQDLEVGGGPFIKSMGLAKLRLDGFSSIQLKSGVTEGQIETIPLTMGKNQVRLILNADCTHGRIIVELVNAVTGKALPGFTYDECMPMQVDDTNFSACWSNNDNLNNIYVPFRIRICLLGDNGSPKLFSIGFQEFS
ncbi:MAG: hypothetical protein JXB29_08315 [Sedimentisphaerales bacterium]|nr:hypothetical protein [Sedimentisphaerales bacterium]